MVWIWFNKIPNTLIRFCKYLTRLWMPSHHHHPRCNNTKSPKSIEIFVKPEQIVRKWSDLKYRKQKPAKLTKENWSILFDHCDNCHICVLGIYCLYSHIFTNVQIRCGNDIRTLNLYFNWIYSNNSLNFFILYAWVIRFNDVGRSNSSSIWSTFDLICNPPHWSRFTFDVSISLSHIYSITKCFRKFLLWYIKQFPVHCDSFPRKLSKNIRASKIATMRQSESGKSLMRLDGGDTIGMYARIAIGTYVPDRKQTVLRHTHTFSRGLGSFSIWDFRKSVRVVHESLLDVWWRRGGEEEQRGHHGESYLPMGLTHDCTLNTPGENWERKKSTRGKKRK